MESAVRVAKRVAITGYTVNQVNALVAKWGANPKDVVVEQNYGSNQTVLVWYVEER